MKIFTAIVFVLTLNLLSGCQSYPTRTSGSVEVASGNTHARVVFSDYDRRLIHDYYKPRKQKHMPPGLAKKQKLPPGLQKQLYRNGKLPPGLQGRHLPGDLEHRLQRLPGDYIRLRVGTDIVLMNRNTRIIVDIIKDIAL